MHHLRLVFAYVRHNLMSAMAYRGAFLLQIGGMILNNAMFLFFWWILFSRIPVIRGWNLSQVLLLFAVVATGFGIANTVFGNAIRLARIIATGQLDYYLSLPVDPLLHVLVSRMSLSAWGDIVFGVGLFLLASGFDMAGLPVFLLLGLAAALVYVAFAVLVGSLAFWIGNAEHLANQVLISLITLAIYPIDVFPSAIRFLLYTLIPSAFVGAVPVAILTGFTWSGLFTLVIVVPLMVVGARLVFKLGLRRYGSGNLIIIRG
jgi:ABC-2 type transport system permease protein